MVSLDAQAGAFGPPDTGRQPTPGLPQAASEALDPELDAERIKRRKVKTIERLDGTVAVKDLKPGHPVYDRLRRKWAGESYTDIQEVRASLKRKLMDFRELVLARRAAEAAAAAEVAEATRDDPETRPC